MPITKKLLAPNKSDKWQVLKMDSKHQFVENHNKKWQMLFGPGSEFTNSAQVVKIAAEFDANTFDNIKMTAYLYNPINGTVDNAATCTFNVYYVQDPDWTETFISAISGNILTNQHFYTNPLLNDLLPASLFGQTTIMIEAVITRLGATYRDRVYVNHLGIYDNVFRLRQDVEWLDISKLDE